MASDNLINVIAGLVKRDGRIAKEADQKVKAKLKAEKEKKRLAEAEKKQLKLFGIVTGKKISEYNVKKIIHEEDGMVHALVDPPVKNFDFGYYTFYDDLFYKFPKSSSLPYFS